MQLRSWKPPTRETISASATLIAVLAGATLVLGWSPALAEGEEAPAFNPLSPTFDPAGALGVLDETSRAAEPTAGGTFLGLATPMNVDPVTGAATASIPIEVPRGRNGLTPRMTISYSSSNGNGPFGVGWNLNLGQVRRGTSDGVPFEYENDPTHPFRYPVPGDPIPGAGDFVVEIGGAQVRLNVYLGDVGGGVHAYGTAFEESLLRVHFDVPNNRWIVRDKSGVEYTYGGGANRTRTGADVTTPYETFAWGLTRIEDPNGNFIAFNYSTLGLTGTLNRYLYPEEIDYGLNSNPAAEATQILFRVAIVYEEENRPDQPVNYLGGFEQVISRRIESINVYRMAPTPLRIRSYDFEYDQDPRTNVSRLTHVGARGKVNGQGQSPELPGTDFKYFDSPNGFDSHENQGPTVLSWPVDPDMDRIRQWATGTHNGDVADLNGDARPDLYYPGTPRSSWRNTGSGNRAFSDPWDPPSGWDNTILGNFSDPGSAIMDMTGDGLPDQIQATSLLSGPWLIGLNNGRGFDDPAEWAFAGTGEDPLQREFLTGEGASPNYSLDRASWNTVDMNGDRKPDRIYCERATLSCIVHPNTGSGFSDAFYTVAGPFYFLLPNAFFYDMNGDGLLDFVTSNGVQLNTGKGWALTPVSWAPDGVSQSPLCLDAFEDGVVAAAMTDINGDGLTDCVDAWEHPWSVRINTGERFTDPQPWSSSDPWSGGPGFGIEKWHFECNGTLACGGWPVTALVDLTGDGVADWVHSAVGNWTIRPGQRRRAGEIKEMQNGLGATTTVAYDSLGAIRGSQAICTGGPEIGKPCTLPAHCSGSVCGWTSDYDNDYLPFPTHVVSSLQRDSGFRQAGQDPTGHVLTTKYDYGDAVYDPEEREVRGFRWFVMRDVDRGRRTETLFEQPGDVHDPQDREDARPFKSKPALVRLIDDSTGKPLTESTYEWALQSLPDGRKLMRLEAQSSTEYGAAGTTSLTRHLIYEYDVYNNRTAVARLEDGASLPLSVTRTAYQHDLERYIVDRPKSIETGRGLTTYSRTVLSYDTRGNPTSIKNCLNELGSDSCSQHSTTTLHYDGAAGATGLPTEIIDARGGSTRIDYGTTPYNGNNRNLYPAKVTNALGHVTYFNYDIAYGKPTFVVQPTGLPHSLLYDEFGRILQVMRGAESVAWRAFDYAFGSPGNPPTPTRTDAFIREPERPSGLRQVSTFVDSFGRQLQTKREDWVEGVDAVVVSGAVASFDLAGRVKEEAAPFVASQGVESWEAPTATDEFTLREYDVLDRPTKTTHPDESLVAADYSTAGVEVLRDENATAPGGTPHVSGNGRTTVTERDAFGRVIETQVFDGALGAEDDLRSRTGHEYDPLDRVVATTSYGSLNESGSNHTTVIFTYDTLGRRVQLNDPDSGVWRYAYDAAGNLVLQQDPKLGQHLEFCYDILNRLRCTIGVADPPDQNPTAPTPGLCAQVVDGDDPCPADSGVQHQLSVRLYDSGSTGTGRVGQVVDRSFPAGSAFPDSVVSTRFLYDFLGRTTTTISSIDAFGIGPREFTNNLSYDTADRLKTTKYPTNNSSIEVFAYSYDPGGRPFSLMTLGQTYVPFAEYDRFGRPTLVMYGPSLLGNFFEYHGADNRFRLAAISVERASNVLQRFVYGPYDPAGNLLGIDDVGSNYPSSNPLRLSNTWVYGYDGLGRLTEATSSGTAWPQPSSTFTYEGYDGRIGNMTSARGMSFTHNADYPHQLASSSPPGSSPAYQYDGNGALTARPDTDGAGEDVALTVEYDMQGRVREASTSHGTVEYVSDASGMRVARRIGGQVTYYFGKAFEITGDQLTRHVSFGGRHIAQSTIQLDSTSPLIVAKISPELRRTMAARALVDFGQRSPRLFPEIALGREDAARLGALLLFLIILLDLTPGRVRLGLTSDRRAVLRRLRRGHVLVLLAVFASSLTPLACVRPVAAGGTSGGGGNSPPPPSYPVYFLHHDHLGSTMMATCLNGPADGTCVDGAVYRYFRYDAYGLMKGFDSTAIEVQDPAQLMIDRLYTGQRWESAIQAYDYTARFYDPRTCRFHGPDPLRESPSPYTYVRWTPTLLTDPSGALTVPDAGGASGINYMHNLGISQGANYLTRSDVRALSSDLLWSEGLAALPSWVADSNVARYVADRLGSVGTDRWTEMLLTELLNALGDFAPRGVGISAGGSLAAGAGKSASATADYAALVGLFQGGPEEPIGIGVAEGGGAFARLGQSVVGAPAAQEDSFSMGASASGGISFFITNAAVAKAIEGPFTSGLLVTPLLSVQFETDFSSGTYVLTLSPPYTSIGVGYSVGIFTTLVPGGFATDAAR